jgi:hypothetical protein
MTTELTADHHRKSTKTLSHVMPQSTSSYIRSRSLSSSRIPRPNPHQAFFEHVKVSSVDTPNHSLRSEILLGFQPTDPHFLVTLSRSNESEDESESIHELESEKYCELRLWDFHPGRPVRLTRRLKVDDQPDYLPVAVVSTCFSVPEETYYQVLYRSAVGYGEGCIEVRCLPLDTTQKSWNVWESVTEEDGLLGGICWNLMSTDQGYITVATASRVYFFMKTTDHGESEKKYWTRGRRCLIFEVDEFLKQLKLPDQNGQYATRLLPSIDKTTSIFVFHSSTPPLRWFELNICPIERRVRLYAKKEIRTSKTRARTALISWSQAHRLMTSHCCEDECGEKLNNGEITVLKTWFFLPFGFMTHHHHPLRAQIKVVAHIFGYVFWQR